MKTADIRVGIEYAAGTSREFERGWGRDVVIILSTTQKFTRNSSYKATTFTPTRDFDKQMSTRKIGFPCAIRQFVAGNVTWRPGIIAPQQVQGTVAEWDARKAANAAESEAEKVRAQARLDFIAEQATQLQDLTDALGVDLGYLPDFGDAVNVTRAKLIVLLERLRVAEQGAPREETVAEYVNRTGDACLVGPFETSP